MVLKMEITKIFIAAQPETLKTDITEIEIFIHRINNCYVGRGHFFTTILDESINDGAARDLEIADCALAFFLVGAGAELPETYKAALNCFNKTGKPKVFVYTKTQCSVVSDQWSADEGNTSALY